MWEIFDASDFVPRSHCGEWSDLWAAGYIAAHIGIFASYVVIPLCLLWIIRQGIGHTLLDVRGEVALFAAFILLCGVGHLEGAVSFGWPAYRLFTLWHLATAVVSISTVGVLILKSVRVVKETP